MQSKNVPLASGKTKSIYDNPLMRDTVRIVSKDDITAGDGKRRDVMEGKAALSTQTTCNVFKFLKSCGLPVAFIRGPENSVEFIANKCKMLPYEVVVRREAHGSYIRRHPEIPKGCRFEELVVEVYLKTSGKRWAEHRLICDDPLIKFIIYSGEIHLIDPKEPAGEGGWAKPFRILRTEEVFYVGNEFDTVVAICGLAKNAFYCLEAAWAAVGYKLADAKMEFGLNQESGLLIADVIDNDSWRLINKKGEYMDKQPYRDGASVEEMYDRYREVARMSERLLDQ